MKRRLPVPALAPMEENQFMEPVSSLLYYLEFQKQMALSAKSVAKVRRQTAGAKVGEFAHSSETIRTDSVPGIEYQPPVQNNALAELDIHRVLVETAEEIDFDLPVFMPVERIKAGIVEMSLAFLLLVAVIGLVII
jgi:hypothetical protein